MFYIVGALMFLNLLIAMINNTYSKLIEYDDALLLIEKYNIMCAMESNLWFVDRRVVPQCYAVVIKDHQLHAPPEEISYPELEGEDDALLGPAVVDRQSIMQLRRYDSGGVINRVQMDRNRLGGQFGELGRQSSLRFIPGSASVRFLNASFHQNRTSGPASNAAAAAAEEHGPMPNMVDTASSYHYAFEMLDEDKGWWGSKVKDEGKVAATTKQVKQKVILLLIMPQNDFHEGVGAPGDANYRPAGSLAVPGSNEDSLRVRDMILHNLDGIDDIIVAMDSHYSTHIAHAIFWCRGPKHPAYTTFCVTHPEPFTVITHQDILDGVWVPVQKENFLIDWVRYYTRELEKKGRLQLTIWPQHCLIGTAGHAVVQPINDAIQTWAMHRKKVIKYSMKGQNLYTEMYSALAAEVEDPTDPRTGMDWDLLAELKIADKILVCGQALRYVEYSYIPPMQGMHVPYAYYCSHSMTINI